MQMKEGLSSRKKHLFKLLIAATFNISPPKIQSRIENVFWRGYYDSHFKSQIKPPAEMRKDMNADKGA